MRVIHAVALACCLFVPVSTHDDGASPAAGTTFMSGSDGTSVTIRGTRSEQAPRQDAPSAPRKDAPPPKKKEPCYTKDAAHRFCSWEVVRVTAPDGTPLSITDLAQFAPDPVATTGEPSNVGIVGLPMNFVTPAAVHTRPGTLLDRTLTVRFTPASFTTDYGDHTTKTTTTGGTSWEDADQPQFTPTATSHTYRERGTYTAHTTIHYTAEVDLGNGYFPVAGELTVDGPAQTITVYKAHTALVEHTCTERPTAPGC